MKPIKWNDILEYDKVSVITNKNRIGNFTSSNAHKLIKTGRAKADLFSDAGYTYIRQRRHERKLKSAISLETFSRSAYWGHAMESRVYNLLGPEYEILSKETKVHPKYHYWSGTVDLIVTAAPRPRVAEVKCFYPEKFCKYADVLLSKDVERLRTTKGLEPEYFQIVSNAAIHGLTRGEAILYMPYRKEAEEIANDIMDAPIPSGDEYKYRWIYEEIQKENWPALPFQPDDSEYPNLVQFEFDIPKEDIFLLEERMELAYEELLNPTKSF